jgi:hypothetical protein
MGYGSNEFNVQSPTTGNPRSYTFIDTPLSSRMRTNAQSGTRLHKFVKKQL